MPRRSDKIWTDEDDAKVRVLWLTGMPAVEIGRRLGVTKNSIIGRKNRLNLPSRESPIKKRTPTQERKPAVRKLFPKHPVVVKPPPIIHRPPPKPPTCDKPCCWPIGDPRESGFRFCEKPAATGHWYCPEHRSIAYHGRVDDEAA